ncbi:MAG TPA: hypothetical protein VF379_02785, partial [Gaiellaceae bacterium]
RAADLGFFAVVVGAVVITCFVVRTDGMLDEVVPEEPPDSRPERIRTMAIVAASRNAAGAA